MTQEQEFFFVLKMRNDALDRGMPDLAEVYTHWAMRIGFSVLKARAAQARIK